MAVVFSKRAEVAEADQAAKVERPYSALGGRTPDESDVGILDRFGGVTET
jgi:hypothetical protein